MAKILPVSKGLLFYSVLYRKSLFDLDKILNILDLDELKVICGRFEFCPMKNYYSKEMGPEDEMDRLYIVDTRALSRSKLCQIKLHCHELENKYLDSTNSRTINIDPGMIALENTIISTTKPYSHRVLIGEGVYAELVYQTTTNKLGVLPWTYPDYQDLRIVNFFSFCREYLKNSIA